MVNLQLLSFRSKTFKSNHQLQGTSNGINKAGMLCKGQEEHPLSA